MTGNSHRFAAALLESDRGGAFVTVPLDVPAVFGARRVPVVATFDGVEYRGSVVCMGGMWIIGVRRDVRKRIGKGVGDMIQVTLQRDGVRCEAEIPDDLLAAAEKITSVKVCFPTRSHT